MKERDAPPQSRWWHIWEVAVAEQQVQTHGEAPTAFLSPAAVMCKPLSEIIHIKVPTHPKYINVLQVCVNLLQRQRFVWSLQLFATNLDWRRKLVCVTMMQLKKRIFRKENKNKQNKNKNNWWHEQQPDKGFETRHLSRLIICWFLSAALWVPPQDKRATNWVCANCNKVMPEGVWAPVFALWVSILA